MSSARESWRYSHWYWCIWKSRPDARPTKNISIEMQLKSHSCNNFIAVIQRKLILSQHNFAHAKAPQLPWNMHDLEITNEKQLSFDRIEIRMKLRCYNRSMGHTYLGRCKQYTLSQISPTLKVNALFTETMITPWHVYKRFPHYKSICPGNAPVTG